MTEQLTPAEAYALLEQLEDKVAEFVDHPYAPELAETIRKVRAVAAIHVYDPAKAEQRGIRERLTPSQLAPPLRPAPDLTPALCPGVCPL